MREVLAGLRARLFLEIVGAEDVWKDVGFISEIKFEENPAELELAALWLEGLRAGGYLCGVCH